MKREAKFRFRTGTKMILPTEFADVFIKGDGNIYVCHDLGLDITYIHNSFSQQNHLIPMQYTGFKDKFGKEIYEGDIIKMKGESGEVGIMTWFGNGYWCEFTNRDGVFALENERKIIGNIYENPELLS